MYIAKKWRAEQYLSKTKAKNFSLLLSCKNSAFSHLSTNQSTAVEISEL
jgi:hypothetical protein